MTLGTLYTFGYQGLSGSTDLRALLEGTDIATVVDCRISPWSGNRAFSGHTRQTVEDAGFRYVHMKGLGNLGYKRGTIEIADIEQIEVVLEYLRTPGNVALMCVCPKPTECHRFELVEAAMFREPDLKVIHIIRNGALVDGRGRDMLRHTRQLDERAVPIFLGI